MIKIKDIFYLVLIIFIAIMVLFFTMSGVSIHTFLYIKNSLDPEGTPKMMDNIIRKNPKDVYEIDQLLYKKKLKPKPNEGDFPSYLEQLERVTNWYMAEKKLDYLDIHWCGENEQMNKMKYIVDYETRTAWGRAKADLGDLSDSTTYYFLVDRNLCVLGWAKE